MLKKIFKFSLTLIPIFFVNFAHSEKIQIRCLGKEEVIIKGRIPQISIKNYTGYIFQEAKKKEKNFFLNWDPYLEYCDIDSLLCNCVFNEDNIICRRTSDSQNEVLLEIILNRYNAELTANFSKRYPQKKKNSIHKTKLITFKANCSRRSKERLF